MDGARRVLITGGTGSLGRALIGRFLQTGIERVCSYARCEVRRAKLIAEYENVHAFLGDVRDPERLELAMYGIDTVIHAAALKRVDAETEADEVRKTNQNGTENVVRASLRAGVKRVVLISSDKAVHPENIYGVSKKAAESFVVDFNRYGFPQGLMTSAVRYGNVLGSRGSVVHVWRDAMAAGKPLRITDPRMTRFWLTLDQAVDLVLYTIKTMRGGEIVIPVLPSMRLTDLAEALAPGYPREIVGLRPGGEKLAERLVSDDEAVRGLRHDGHIMIPPDRPNWTTRPWEGERLPDGFRYVSDVNDRWVSVQEMREWLKTVPA